MGRRKKVNTSTGWTGQQVPAPISLVGRGKYNSLDEIFGDAGAKYKTHDENEYLCSIKEMNFADLQRECTRVGLLPQIDRQIMEARLMEQFKQYVVLLKGPEVKPVVIKPTKEALDVMSATQSNLQK